MTPSDWAIISGLIDEWWPGKFDDGASAAWFVALEAVDADRVTVALKTLLLGGGTFRPSVAEVVAQIHHDPSAPTFEEALMLIRAAFRAGRRPLTGNFDNEAQMIGAREDLIRVGAREMHPLVASFVARCSDLSRLQDEMSELSGGDYAGARRRDLQGRWEAHVQAMQGRDVAAIAAGPRREGLRLLDPLAMLGIAAAAPELEQGQPPKEAA